MANIPLPPSKFQYNLLLSLAPYAKQDDGVVNAIVEVSKGSINKYETITESGQLKLDRVGYSSLAYPFTYGAIPQTWDADGDPLDIEIVKVTEDLVPGSLVEARVIGVMKMIDGDEVDDKIIAVLNDDKRTADIQTLADLGKHFKEETKHFWEFYKHLKKPGSVQVAEFMEKAEALKIIDECAERYQKDYASKVV